MDELTPVALAAVLDEPQVDLLAEALTIKANASNSSYAPRCPRTLRCSSSHRYRRCKGHKKLWPALMHGCLIFTGDIARMRAHYSCFFEIFFL